MSVVRTLYQFPLDPASRQVRLALGEKRLPFTDVVERYWERRPEFFALNPSGLTPVLVEEDGPKRLILCEARAILDQQAKGDAGTGPLPKPIYAPPSRPTDPPGS